jgi:hypothetical protein
LFCFLFLSPWGLLKYGAVSKRFFCYGRFLTEVRGSEVQGLKVSAAASLKSGQDNRKKNSKKRRETRCKNLLFLS